MRRDGPTLDAMKREGDDLITVAVVEDDPLVRRSLAGILNRGDGLRCISQSASGEEALRDLPRLAPRVVLMDLQLPGMDGVECVRQLSGLLPAAHIVMLTVHEDTEAIFKSLSAGASGYLLKPIRAAQLLAAVRDVFAGGSPMASNIARKVVQAFRKPAAARSPAVELSPREREVLDFLAKGFLYKEIAEKLDISYSTVHTYIERIYQKLHVRSRAQAVARYLRA